MYLIGFIRKSIKVNKSVVIDHVFFNACFHAFFLLQKKILITKIFLYI